MKLDTANITADIKSEPVENVNPIATREDHVKLETDVENSFEFGSSTPSTFDPAPSVIEAGKIVKISVAHS